MGGILGKEKAPAREQQGLLAERSWIKAKGRTHEVGGILGKEKAPAREQQGLLAERSWIKAKGSWIKVQKKGKRVISLLGVQGINRRLSS